MKKMGAFNLNRQQHHEPLSANEADRSIVSLEIIRAAFFLPGNSETADSSA